MQLLAKLEHPVPHTMSALEHERWVKKLVSRGSKSWCLWGHTGERGVKKKAGKR